MGEHYNRLCRCGLRPDDAWLICRDFERELNFDGLEEYVSELESIHMQVVKYESKKRREPIFASCR